MKRGQVTVRGILPDGNEGAVDVLDLDEESFRAFFVGLLIEKRFYFGKQDANVPGPPIKLRHKDAPPEAAPESTPLPEEGQVERNTEEVKAEV